MTAALKCAVVGAGVMGAAAAYRLARRGANVVLFDRFDLFHRRGSSHGPTRLFRMAYFEHPDYVPLLQRADAEWRALEKARGEVLFHRTGIFLAGPADSAVIAGTLRASKDHHLPIHRLTARDVKARLSWFDLPTDFETLIEPAAGVLLARRAHAAFIDGARDMGATVAAGVKVLGWSPTRDGIEVASADGKQPFDRLVVAPGAWASSLLGDVGALVTPMRKFLFWAAADEPTCTIGSGFPPFAIERPDRRMFYGFPAIDADGIKLGEHTGGVPLSAPEDDVPSDEARADVQAFLRDVAPGLPQAITKDQTCLYAMSPDGHFLIDAHPHDARVVFAAGFSGHGFKFAPVVGEALADLALTGETLREFDFLKAARFGDLKARRYST